MPSSALSSPVQSQVPFWKMGYSQTEDAGLSTGINYNQVKLDDLLVPPSFNLSDEKLPYAKSVPYMLHELLERTTIDLKK